MGVEGLRRGVGEKERGRFLYILVLEFGEMLLSGCLSEVKMEAEMDIVHIRS